MKLVFLSILLSISFTLFTQTELVEVQNTPLNSVSVQSSSCVDLDSDNNLDLFLCPYPSGKNLYFHNNGDGTFSKVTEGIIVEIETGFKSSSWADFDNDNDLDAYINTYNISGANSNYVFTNNGNGTFNSIEIALSTGIGFAEGTWFDYNLDGYLDMIVSDRYNLGSLLFTNNTENDFIQSFLLANTGPFLSQDFNNDLWPDITTTSYWNFVIALNKPYETFPYPIHFSFEFPEPWNIAAGDWNNDGFTDVFMASENYQFNYLFTNIDGENFLRTNQSGAFGNNEFGLSSSARSIAWLDYDNDADLDLFITNRLYDEGERNLLYKNNEGTSFSRITSGPFVETNSDEIVYGDFDKNGFLDLFITYCSQGNKLLMNTGNLNNWINIHLQGSVSNYSAIGAKVKVKSNLGWQYREVMSNTSNYSQSTMNVHFGFGQINLIDTLMIVWPSGIVSNYFNLETNQFINIVEPAIKRKVIGNEIILYLPRAYGENTHYQWLLNGVTIPQANANEIKVLENGFYRAIIYQGFSTDTTFEISIQDMGINTASVKNCLVSIYPNPVDHFLNIRTYSSDIKITEIKLYDPSGRLIQSYFPKQEIQSYKININNCSSGLYYLNVKTNLGQAINRVMIK